MILMLRNRRQSQRVKLTFSAPQLWCRSCICLWKQTGHRKVGISVPDLSEANVNDKSSRTDLYYTTTTSHLPITLHTLHIKSTHWLTLKALHLRDASSYEPQLQALAAARLLQDLLDPLSRPRPPQHRVLPPSSSQASRKKRPFFLKSLQLQESLAPRCIAYVSSGPTAGWGR